jgi:membrane associated rhomboid family serine protease
MVRSRARGSFEDLAFVLGTEIFRCAACESRFIGLLGFNFASPGFGPDAGKDSSGRAFKVAWFAIIGGFLTCVAIALWTLRKFHRWPF